MKTNKSLLIVIGLLIGFVAGLIVGMIFSNQRVDNNDATGTIGKVDKYRNVKITEADIELQNELLNDEKLRNAFTGYMNYEYAATVKFFDDVRFAIEQSGSLPDFLTENEKVVAQLEGYAKLLENCRLHLLDAVVTVNEMTTKDQIAMSAVLNKANNALIQIRQGNKVAFNFLSVVETFLQNGEIGTFPELEEAYSRIFNNLVTSSMVSNDRVAFEYLLSKNRLTTKNTSATLDNAALKGFVLNDSQKLSLCNLEKLNDYLNSENLSFLVRDIHNLGAIIFLNAEKLQSENIGSFGINIPIIASFDAEKLASFRNAEELGIIIPNIENLKFIITNIEKLNSNDLLSSELLRAFI